LERKIRTKRALGDVSGQIFGFHRNARHRAPFGRIRAGQMNITNALVVDDDIAVCRILHRILSEEQYTVQTSQSVADALGIIEQKHFDVYVMDYRLPDGSGLDVAERIRSKGSEAPIILMSGYDADPVTQRAEKLCISDFLQKPFSRERICNAVEKAIGPANGASQLSSSKSPSPAAQTHPIPILPAFKDVIGTMDTTLKRDRLTGRLRGRFRFRFRNTDREMVPAAYGETFVYIVLAIEAVAFVLLAGACFRLIIQILPK
jgi:CheY-like chemotaxis protein